MANKLNSWLAMRFQESKIAYEALMKVYPFTLEDLPEENWYDVKNFDGDYQISTFGRLKSLKHNEPIIIKPFLSQKGYLRVSLSKDNKPHQYFIHDLVGLAFIPNLDGKPEIDHIDGNKFNNHVKNLRWVTSAENHQYAVELGLKKSGTNRTSAKLNAEQIKYIREVYKPRDSKFGARALAKKFNVSLTTIRDIVHRRKYKDID